MTHVASPNDVTLHARIERPLQTKITVIDLPTDNFAYHSDEGGAISAKLKYL